MMIEPTKKEWNDFCAARSHAQFLQSWEWGVFQESLGITVHRTAVRDEQGEIAACVLLLELPLFGNFFYLYAPRGPIGYFPASLYREILNSYQVKKRHPLFIRHEPSQSREGKEGGNQKGIHTLSVQPEREWILDLSKSKEELYADMHPKTRYNIRLASKKNVQVSRIDTADGSLEHHIDSLYGFLQKTAIQKEYRLHDRAYYTALITFFRQSSHEGIVFANPHACLYEASCEGIVVGSICIMYFGDTAYYLYGGSDQDKGALMTPFALHAHAWNDARIRGYRYYNFGGIAPEGAMNHPLSGVTRFKRGFGGEHILYPGTFDIILNPVLYMIYTIGRPFWRMFNRIR